MFKTPTSVSQLILYRRRWSLVYIAASVFLTFLGMAARVETLSCQWRTELLRIIPAVFLAVVLLFVKKRRIYSALTTGKYIYHLVIAGLLLLIGNSLLSLHTPPQVVGQLLLLAVFSFSCICLQQNDASNQFVVALISSCPLLAVRSLPGTLICLVPGILIMYPTCAKRCRAADPQWKLPTRVLLSGLLTCAAVAAITALIYSRPDGASPFDMMVCAQNSLRNARLFGCSWYLDIWAIDYSYPMGWDPAGYLGTVVGHSLGLIPMSVIFLTMTVWGISIFHLGRNLYYSASDCLVRYAAKQAGAALAIPAVLFMLQNLGLFPHTDAVAPFLDRNMLGQLLSVLLSCLLLSSGELKTDPDPKLKETIPEDTYTLHVVEERTDNRLAA